MMSIRKHFDSLTVFSIVIIIIGFVFFGLNSQIQSSEEKGRIAEEKRQMFENNLLATLVHNQLLDAKNTQIKNHNEEIIIHNQVQFSKFGMGHNGTVTPGIRTDFQTVIGPEQYWIAFNTSSPSSLDKMRVITNEISDEVQ